MTERLSDLMTAEADLLDIPAPPATAVLSRGRRLRRQRHGLQLGAGLAALALVGGLTVALTGNDDTPAALDPSASPSSPASLPDLGAVFAIGPEVYLTGPGVTATIDDVAVKSMYYTSAGVLVRHGDNNYSDGGGDQRFSLVTPDGTVKPIDVVTNEVVPGVDVDQALLAYAEVVDGTVEVVVHDLTSDEEVARVPVPDATEWGGWSAPPVSLTGDDVYVGTDDIARVVDWRTGEVSESNNVAPGFPPQVYGGLATELFDAMPRIYDPTTGNTVATLESNNQAYGLSLSPDGRFAMVDTMSGPVDVYSVETEKTVTVPQGGGLAWAPDGTLISLDDSGELTTCSAETGECATEQLDLDVLPNSSSDPEDFSDDVVLGNDIRES